MQLARVEGHATASVSHPSMRGCKLLLCQPIDDSGNSIDTPSLAIDAVGAGMHSRVIITTDGASTQAFVKDTHSPLRNMIVAIVDEPKKEQIS